MAHHYVERNAPTAPYVAPLPAFQSIVMQGPLNTPADSYTTWHSFTVDDYARWNHLDTATAQAVLDQAIADGILVDQGDS